MVCWKVISLSRVISNSVSNISHLVIQAHRNLKNIYEILSATMVDRRKQFPFQIVYKSQKNLIFAGGRWCKFPSLIDVY